MPTTWTITRIAGYAAAGTAALALTLAGCGSSGNSGGSAKPAGSTGTTAGTGATAGGTTLTTFKVDKLGTVVTDGKGFVLYRFDNDSAKPSKSTCTGDCAALWPPEKVNGKITATGIDPKLVSTVKRPDGSTQMTLAGWPLYRYTRDDEPHEAYGQGVDGTWFAATPTGAKAMGASGTSSSGAPGY
ncbi:hypothetical protein ACWCP6_03390 [Streptomyces sp. NPDC002004]